jgi:hypothetical protein
MCKGEAHGDFDLRTMPADSNLLNSALAICIEATGLGENGGVATGVDVMLDPWLGVGFTSSVRKMEGNFCNRVLTSSGMESRIFL